MKKISLIGAVLLSLVFAAYFSWFDIVRHQKTNSTRFDLGNVEQLEWNLIHGRGFVSTDPYGTATISRFAFHADPFLIALAPFYVLAPRTEALLILQAVAVASGAIAVWLIGKKLLSDWWGLLFTALYIINPAIHWATMFDVHAVTFATPLILWAAWCALSKRYWVTFILVGLAMMTKEEIGLGLALIGIFVWWRQRNKIWGPILTLLPLIWSLAMLFFVLPHYRGLSAANGEVYQTVFGPGAMNVVTGALHHPVTFAHQLLSKQNLTMAFQLVSPLGLLPLLSWWSVGGVPDYGINALSLKPAQHLVISHYTSGLTPWLFLGAMMTVGWLLKHVWPKVKLEHDRKSLSLGLAAWLLGWSAYSAWAIGPLPGAKNDNSAVVRWRNDYAASVRVWENFIPSSAAVSVTNDIGSHFARREHVFSFPLGVDQSDYVIVLEHHATPVVATDVEVSAKISALRHDSTWEVLQQQGDLTVLHRKR